jgi:hypothetical protein
MLVFHPSLFIGKFSQLEPGILVNDLVEAIELMVGPV